MKPLLLAIALVMLLPSARADARRRKPKGKIYGVLKAPFLEKEVLRRLPRAYWAFGVAHLQRRIPKPDYRQFMVFLDHWDDKSVPSVSRTLTIKGAAFQPDMLIIPRPGPSDQITVHNRDLLTHRITSADHAGFKNMKLVRAAKQNVTVDNILPLQKGNTVTYRVRSKDLPRMQCEIVYIKSTIFARADKHGRFLLKHIPKGSYTFRVYFRGKVLFTKSVEVGRKSVNLKVLKLKPAE